MNRCIMVMVGMVLMAGVAASQNDEIWKMRIHKGQDVELHNLAEIDSVTFFIDVAPEGFTHVPAGVFTMGDGAAYCGTDEREVTLTRDFFLGQHEVTNQEYMEAVQWAYDNEYVTATTCTVRDNLDGSTVELLDLDGHCEISFSDGIFSLRDAGHGINPDHPVMDVTWYGVVSYCDWLSLQAGLSRAYEHGGDWQCNSGDPYGAVGYRLPTDAEWEYAAQYDDERIYPWGDDALDCDRANADGCVYWTTPVGDYPDAPETLELSDMAGNVWEWCNDWHQCNLGTGQQADPHGPVVGIYRVLRGGSFGSTPTPETYRCAYRHNFLPGNSDVAVGFRIARTVQP
ncbi:MAG: formylglycine-generating enzyme family protein [Candidatus Eisenbacteria bacterium]|uniref:Formylglycine-generating enzyme family protein n=1 Tax=Eiseniibacteriota bacterium TaxID=2212470 RepID=A0A948RWW6_UNCEI|nr:formylglycine-generating enzyme family protein [Candidatus Eisenbacteria bacterium]MBU1948259.1 formylglycine-generating enzyme family protein [Candidatus Eisenbacteria bacterium]MBU2691986.1 formylglycine-generating enzyme family protein [Candidatus Eisenbacteria bacterium]